jgi:formylglycine-generating enzyme required for sulfatase activity
MLRNAGFSGTPWQVRIARRVALPPGYRHGQVGFRLARGL